MVRIETHRWNRRALNQTANVAFPAMITIIVEEEKCRNGGNSHRALETLRDRLIDDPTLTVERARLVRWLVAQENLTTRLRLEQN